MCTSGKFGRKKVHGMCTNVDYVTLLGRAEYTCVSWEQSLSDVSGFWCDYNMLKDMMCQAHEAQPCGYT